MEKELLNCAFCRSQGVLRDWRIKTGKAIALPLFQNNNQIVADDASTIHGINPHSAAVGAPIVDVHVLIPIVVRYNGVAYALGGGGGGGART